MYIIPIADDDTDAEFDTSTLRRIGRIVNQASETDDQDVDETPCTVKRKKRAKGIKNNGILVTFAIRWNMEYKSVFFFQNEERFNILWSS